jgi:hypothetical protein
MLARALITCLVAAVMAFGAPASSLFSPFAGEQETNESRSDAEMEDHDLADAGSTRRLRTGRGRNPQAKTLACAAARAITPAAPRLFILAGPSSLHGRSARLRC